MNLNHFVEVSLHNQSGLRQGGAPEGQQFMAVQIPKATIAKVTKEKEVGSFSDDNCD